MSRKNFKRVKGTSDIAWLKTYQGQSPTGNLMLEAMTNPDLLSDEQSMYEERDFDAEYERRKFLVYFRFSLRHLTARQKQIVDAMQYMTQEDAAKSLGIKRSTLSMHLQIIQKKMIKHIGKLKKKEQDMQGYNKNED